MESSSVSSSTLGASASFRGSDAEFLQTEAREWLEAVLEEKLDAGTSLQDLLADGTILYRISQIIKEQLRRHSTEVVHLPATLSSPDVNRRSTSLKYQPYSYVEAFLKVCKDVGLLDLDLFNPSDAVDKKDIRHVCICLRRLSKQARTLNVQLPEFDNVKQHAYKHAVEAGQDKTPSKFRNEIHKDTSPSIQDPNDVTSLVVDEFPSREPMEVTVPTTSADTDFRSVETTASPSEDTDVSLESDVVVDGEPMEVTVPTTSADTDFRSVETTFDLTTASSPSEDTGVSLETDAEPMEVTTSTDFRSVETTFGLTIDTDISLETDVVVDEDPSRESEEVTTSTSADMETTFPSSEATYVEVVQTSVSDESALPGPEKPHVNGVDLTGHTSRGDGRSPAPLKQMHGTKLEKRNKRKGWWRWFPYAAAGAAVVVGAVVVLQVVSKEKTTSSGESTLAEIARQTHEST